MTPATNPVKMAPMANVEESVAGDLRREFPELFARSEAFDFGERLGGSTSDLDREADAALRELWMVRTNLNEAGESFL